MGDLVFYQSLFHKIDHISWISDTKYDPLGNSNLSFHVLVDVLNLLFLYNFLKLKSIYYKLRFDKATNLSLHFKFILSERLSNSLWG